jgi:hypothetical protein
LHVIAYLFCRALDAAAAAVVFVVFHAPTGAPAAGGPLVAGVVALTAMFRIGLQIRAGSVAVDKFLAALLGTPALVADLVSITAVVAGSTIVRIAHQVGAPPVAIRQSAAALPDALATLAKTFLFAPTAAGAPVFLIGSEFDLASVGHVLIAVAEPFRAPAAIGSLGVVIGDTYLAVYAAAPLVADSSRLAGPVVFGIQNWMKGTGRPAQQQGGSQQPVSRLHGLPAFPWFFLF